MNAEAHKLEALHIECSVERKPRTTGERNGLRELLEHVAHLMEGE
jgi:hypothetical protein